MSIPFGARGGWCLGVSTALVYRLCDFGELTHVRVSNAIRVQVGDLVAYLRSNRS